MATDLSTIHFYAFAGVMVCWIIFAALFLLRKRYPKPNATQRETSSFIGIAMQAVGFAIIWTLRRPPATPLLELSPAADGVIGALAVILAAASVWMALSAVRALGAHWSVGAQLIEGHQLITSGPYALVRHPIYTAMFGLLLSTGLVASVWTALPPAVVFFYAGTTQRTRTEERLLRELFGSAFDEYAARVPAFIPHFKGRKGP
jgi:protein-S-isoprenylcysteine O-methyltransferase Ste14